MTKFMYSILDCVSKQFCEPICQFNDADAARMFRAWLSTNAEKYGAGFRSTDYKIFRVGMFDLFTGEASPSSEPVEVAVNEGDNI